MTLSPTTVRTWLRAAGPDPLPDSRTGIRNLGAFDDVFRGEGIEILRTPVRAPQANAVAERFVRTVRLECLDWLLILGARHLERALREFLDHYNGHRPHRALRLGPPQPRSAAPPTWSGGRVQRRDRLGGLIHEYRVAA